MAWTVGLLPRIWQLRRNRSIYDASSIALAAELQVPLITHDERMTKGPPVGVDFKLV